MIRLDSVQLKFGGQTIFKDVNWQVKDDDRIGLVGPNGAGKTTLLRMITGKVGLDRGEVIVPKNTTIGHMPQELVFLKGKTVFEEVRTVFNELLQIQDSMHEIAKSMEQQNPDYPGYQKLLDDYGHLQDRFATMDGYQIDAKVGEVLHGLGFAASDWDRRVEEFSGGWQMRIVLAKLLLSKPRILLLDEPTNHLDLEARNWLEDYLKNYPGTVILVSHDRYFLDVVTHRITEIEFGNITDYYTNYSGYLKDKQERYERLESQFKRQQDSIKKTQAFINKYRYDKKRASLVQSRIKMLDKIDQIELPPRPKTIRFSFPEPPRSGRIVIELKNIHKSYDDLKVFQGLNLLIEKGERIGLVGPNGAGKSTLMRILAGHEQVQKGERIIGHNVFTRFMDQEVTSSLNMQNTVLNELQSAAPYDIVPHIRTLLGAFLFSGDDINKVISVLSGGEKSRLAIARMLLEPSNVLLLDEPTNHLDIKSQEILLDALQKFPGTVVFVSHERYFINELAEKIIDVHNGQIYVYPGNYEDYLRKKAKDAMQSVPVTKKTADPEKKKPGDDERVQRKMNARKQKKRVQELQNIEKAIHETEKELRNVENMLADPENYRDGARMKELSGQHKTLKNVIKELYDRWMEADKQG